MSTSLSTDMADKLLGIAESLQCKADDKLRARAERTPKQQREASVARCDGYNFKVAADTARALSNGYRDGSLPKGLEKYKSGSSILAATSCRTVCGTGYYSCSSPDVDNFHDKSQDALKLRAFCSGMVAPEDLAATKHKIKLDTLLSEIRQSNIDGFFPTPDPVIDIMLQGLDLRFKDVLEPSAGIGSIADRAKVGGKTSVLCVERQHKLCDVLSLKGHMVLKDDFLKLEAKPYFSVVLMNPPFEKDQAIDHVQHAFKFLKPGGYLRAIMPGVANRFDESRTVKRVQFAQWVDSQHSSWTEIPHDAFKNGFCPTGVSTVLLSMRVSK